MSKATQKLSMETEPAAEGHPSHGEIEVRAHEIYVDRGGAHGQDVEDWVQAERELIG